MSQITPQYLHKRVNIHAQDANQIMRTSIGFCHSVFFISWCLHFLESVPPESYFLYFITYNLNCQSYLQGLSVAPLWDFCKGQFVGVLSASDFVLILREVY